MTICGAGLLSSSCNNLRRDRLAVRATVIPRWEQELHQSFSEERFAASRSIVHLLIPIQGHPGFGQAGIDRDYLPRFRPDTLGAPITQFDPANAAALLDSAALLIVKDSLR